MRDLIILRFLLLQAVSHGQERVKALDAHTVSVPSLLIHDGTTIDKEAFREW